VSIEILRGRFEPAAAAAAEFLIAPGDTEVFT
jgi:hypothetical protein